MINDIGMECIAEAIIKEAAREYRVCMRQVLSGVKEQDNYALYAKVRELEEFFCSDWFYALSGFDGGWFLKKLKRNLHRFTKNQNGAKNEEQRSN